MADPWVGLMREVAPDWPAAGMQSDDDWLWLWRGAQERAVRFRSLLKARIETFGDKCWDELCADSKAAQHFQALGFLLGTRRALCSLAGVEPPPQQPPKAQRKGKAVKTEETQHTQAILDVSMSVQRKKGEGAVPNICDICQMTCHTKELVPCVGDNNAQS